jgi:hypothetical protein
MVIRLCLRYPARQSVPKIETTSDPAANYVGWAAKFDGRWVAKLEGYGWLSWRDMVG